MSQKSPTPVSSGRFSQWNRGKIIYLVVGVACCAFGAVQIATSLT
jgi:hypothetical protein